MSNFGFSIGKFIADIQKSGVAYKTKYQLEFGSYKNGNRVYSRSQAEKINSRLESVSFPAASIGSKGVNLQGIEREMPYGRIFEGDIKLTFLEDSKFTIRNFFGGWQNKIIDNTNFTCGYYNDYVCEQMIITAHSINTSESAIYTVQVIDVFPKVINAIEMSTASDELVKTEIDMSFRRWTVPIDRFAAEGRIASLQGELGSITNNRTESLNSASIRRGPF